MRTYKETHGVLIKKYRNFIGEYIFVLKSDNSKTIICVGKGIYMCAAEGSRWTIGHIGRKLINIRPGFCSKLDE